MLGLLQLMSKRLCRLETKKLGWYYRLLVRFRLESTPDILAQFEVTGGALNAWAAEAAKSEPRPIGDSALVFATWQCDHQKHADALFPLYQAEYKKLEHMMRLHLDSLQESR